MSIDIPLNDVLEKVSVNLKYHEDGKERKVSPSIKNKLKFVKKVVSGVANIAKKADTVMLSAFDGSLKLEWLFPEGSINATFEYKELPGQFKVEPEFTALIKLDPLIGIQFTAELDEIILTASTGPVGKIYARLKRIAESNGAEIGILKLEISGTLSMDFGIKRLVGDTVENKSGAGAVGKIEADLKVIKVSIKFQTIVVNEAELEAGVKTGIELSGDLYRRQNFIAEIETKFTGLKAYYSIKANGGWLRKAKNWLGMNGDKGISKEDDWILVKEKVFYSSGPIEIG